MPLLDTSRYLCSVLVGALPSAVTSFKSDTSVPLLPASLELAML